MKRIKHLVILVLFLGGLNAYAQKNEVIQRYIDEYKELAMEEMQRTGVPASIKLAQGIHETMAGTSPLVLKSNNHFGIKCKSNWKGESVSHDDDARGECFRKYPSSLESYRDHSDFLRGGSRYAFLFDLDPTDYRGWANGLKKAGYATNPQYPLLIIKLVEEYGLQDYTLIAMGRKAPAEVVLARVEEKDPARPVAVVAKEVVPAVARPSYPDGEFRINETRVIFVKKGTPYLSIALEYNVSLGRIFEFNDLREMETAQEDQLVYLQRKRKTGKDEFHIVRPGETLYDIAQEQAIRLGSLLEYNGFSKQTQPAVGDKLWLRNKSPRLALNSIPSEGKTDGSF